MAWHLIGVVKDCCTVERNSAEYYMITSVTGDHKVHDWIVGTVKEFEEEEGGE